MEVSPHESITGTQKDWAFPTVWDKRAFFLLPMIPRRAATPRTFLEMTPAAPPLPSFLQVPITPSDPSKKLSSPRLSLILLTPRRPNARASLARNTRANTDVSLHTRKSAKVRRWHRQKHNKSLPFRGRGSATLYLRRQNKGRPVEHSGRVYFRAGNNACERRGRRLMWHSRALPKNTAVLLFTSQRV